MRFLHPQCFICNYYTRKNKTDVSGFLWKNTAPELEIDRNFGNELRNLVIAGGNEMMTGRLDQLPEFVNCILIDRMNNCLLYTSRCV